MATGGGTRIVIVDEKGRVVSNIPLDELLKPTDLNIDSVTKNLGVNVSQAEILTPVDVQSHWGEAVTLKASGAETATGTGTDVDIERFITGVICIDVTAVSGTFAAGEGLKVVIEGKDEVSGKYKTLYDTSADPDVGMITAPTTVWYEMTQNDMAFRYIRARWEITGTTPSFTFSVTGQFKA